jgi:hypothetical protein
MKKSLLLFVICEILFSSTVGRIIDYNLLQRNIYPIFSFPLMICRDGGTIVYYGTTYKIVALHSLSDDSKDVDGYKTGTILLNWFQEIDFDKYLADENISKFIESDNIEEMKNEYFILVSFLIHLQIFVCIIILLKRKKV